MVLWWVRDEQRRYCSFPLEKKKWQWSLGKTKYIARFSTRTHWLERNRAGMKDYICPWHSVFHCIKSTLFYSLYVKIGPRALTVTYSTIREVYSWQIRTLLRIFKTFDDLWKRSEETLVHDTILVKPFPLLL